MIWLKSLFAGIFCAATALVVTVQAVLALLVVHWMFSGTPPTAFSPTRPELDLLSLALTAMFLGGFLGNAALASAGAPPWDGPQDAA